MDIKLEFWIFDDEKVDSYKYMPKNTLAAKLCGLLEHGMFEPLHSFISDGEMDRIWEFADSAGLEVDYIEAKKSGYIPRPSAHECRYEFAF